MGFVFANSQYYDIMRVIRTGVILIHVHVVSSLCCRDVAHISTCDDGCLALAELLGWKVSHTMIA